MAVRDIATGRSVAREIVASTGNAPVAVAPLDLADLASVRAFIADWTGPLHILVNNAGVMGVPLTRTRQGWELHFATNHLGHFALTAGLHPALAVSGDARVVSVSSSQHRLSAVVFEDVHFEHRPYDPQIAYGQSKTANALFAVAAADRWANVGIAVNAVMPGIVRTNLSRHADPAALANFMANGGALLPWKTVERGAATSVLLATSPLLDKVTGHYFEDCNEAEPLSPDNPHGGVTDYALEPDNAARLWGLSVRATTSA